MTSYPKRNKLATIPLCEEQIQIHLRHTNERIILGIGNKEQNWRTDAEEQEIWE